MTGNKWRVDRVHHVWPEPHHAWQVTEALARGVFDYHGPFPTHAEALAYADRMARTVEVTLPRDPLVWESGWDSDGRIYVEEANGNEICYESGQLGEIALALLAHHHRKDRN